MKRARQGNNSLNVRGKTEKPEFLRQSLLGLINPVARAPIQERVFANKKYKERLKDPMFWRIVGIVSLVGGAVVFYILVTTPLPSPPQISPSKSLEFTIYLLSTFWLISSAGVKIGLIFNKPWMKLSIFSCICFIFLLINMGLMQAALIREAPVPEPQPNSLYPYNLVAWWFVSWFWIDLLVIITAWMKKRWLRNRSN